MEEITAAAALLIATAVMAISATTNERPLTPADKVIIELEQEARQKEQEALQAYEQADDFMHGVVYEPMSEPEKEKHHAKQ